MFESLASCFAFRCSALLNMTRVGINKLPAGSSVCVDFARDVFHFERAAADVQVALRIRDLDSGSSEMLIDQIIQVAAEAPRTVTHFAAPGNQFEIDGAIAKFLQKRS